MSKKYWKINKDTNYNINLALLKIDMLAVSEYLIEAFNSGQTVMYFGKDDSSWCTSQLASSFISDGYTYCGDLNTLINRKKKLKKINKYLQEQELINLKNEIKKVIEEYKTSKSIDIDFLQKIIS